MSFLPSHQKKKNFESISIVNRPTRTPRSFRTFTSLNRLSVFLKKAFFVQSAPLFSIAALSPSLRPYLTFQISLFAEYFKKLFFFGLSTLPCIIFLSALMVKKQKKYWASEKSLSTIDIDSSCRYNLPILSVLVSFFFFFCFSFLSMVDGSSNPYNFCCKTPFALFSFLFLSISHLAYF